MEELAPVGIKFKTSSQNYFDTIAIDV